MRKQVQRDVKRGRYFSMDAWTSSKQAHAELAKITAKGTKINALKDQIKIRTVGYDWVEYHVVFKDKGVEALTTELIKIINQSSRRSPPTELPSSVTRTSALNPLGTLSAKGLELRQRSLWTFDEMRESRDELQREFEEAEQARKRSAHDSMALDQPEEPPPLDASLIGKRLEILTQLVDEDEDGNIERSYKQWLPVIVLAMSTGDEKRPTATGRQQRVKPGQFFLSYDDGTKEWSQLKPDDFNCARKGSWRLDLDFSDHSGGSAGGGGGGGGGCGSDEDADSDAASREEGDISGPSGGSDYGGDENSDDEE